MRNVEKIVDMEKFTEKGQRKVIEAYEVINRMDQGLSKDDITIINNFSDEFPFEFYKMMRDKERVMHGIRI